jgi:hypothetical protein
VERNKRSGACALLLEQFLRAFSSFLQTALQFTLLPTTKVDFRGKKNPNVTLQVENNRQNAALWTSVTVSNFFVLQSFEGSLKGKKYTSVCQNCLISVSTEGPNIEQAVFQRDGMINIRHFQNDNFPGRSLALETPHLSSHLTTQKTAC